MNLRVVFLEDRSGDSFQVFALPVDFEVAGNRVHEAFVAFKDFQRTGNATHGEEGGVGARESGVGVREPFPMRQGAGPCDPQSVESRSADRQGVGGPGVVEA